MKRFVRLTESDLIELVKKVIKEQSSKPNNYEELKKLLSSKGYKEVRPNGFLKTLSDKTVIYYAIDTDVDYQCVRMYVEKPSQDIITKLYLKDSGKGYYSQGEDRYGPICWEYSGNFSTDPSFQQTRASKEIISIENKLV